ncbi:MAG: NUDIX domain-containing protein [Clostridia bacterium]
MEIFDIYDENRIKTGKTMIRGYKFAPGAYHMVIHVCIFNSDDKMLIQQRQPFKKGWSNLWDLTVGGSAISGETSAAAAEREVLEEIGYRLNLKNMRPNLTINHATCFNDIYLLKRDLDINGLHLQYSEVQRVKWATKDEIKELIDIGVFIPYYKSFIDLLFDMRHDRGVRSTNE